ncbi:hypothetical protein BOX15_Mlig021009g1 [Macrostomum lignano]|nr:hypothetical protein BOX15_Mlig021009g1 [Macrostomum lignano]
MATLDPSAVAAAAAVAASVESDEDKEEDDEGGRSSAANVVAAAAKAGRAFAVGIHQLVTDELREVLQLPPPPLPPAPTVEPASAGPDEEASPTAAVGPADWEPPERTRYFLRPRFRRRPPSDEAELVEAVRQRLAGVPGVCRLSTAESPADTSRPQPAPQRIGKLQAWSAMKRRDRVDQVLVEELRQEEPGWVDYEVDETEAKLKVADEVLAQLLADTAICLRDLHSRAS